MERWVSPPLVPREPTPRWLAVWRFRAVMLLLGLLLVGAVYLLWLWLSGATEQDPGVEARSLVTSTSPEAAAPR